MNIVKIKEGLILIKELTVNCNNEIQVFLYLFPIKEDVLGMTLNCRAQPAGTVEYIVCISAEGQDSPPLMSDIKQSDGEALVMLERWGMQINPLLPSLPGPFWLGVVAPDSVLSMGQTELNCILILS